MYKYRYKKNGQVLESTCPIFGDNWEEVKEEPKKDTKKRTTKKKTTNE